MNGSDQAFPSVYLLRGDEREWANPRQDNHREGRSALVVADDLVRAGRMREQLIAETEQGVREPQSVG